jgi:hypothetical protein
VVVGHHHRGGAGLDEDPAQVVGEALPQPRVQGAERLVEQEQPGRGREGAGQRDTLPFAAGEGRRQPVRERREADEVEQVADPSVDLGPGGVTEPQRVGDVASHRQLGEELAVLEHQREAAAVGRRTAQVVALPGHRARGGLEAGDRAQQGGLARARGPEDGEHPALGQVEVGVGDGGDPVVGHREPAHRQRDVARRHSVPTDRTRSRSTSSMTSAVAPPSTTEAARAMP